MNAIIATLGIESWKAIVAALVLPPTPFLLLAVAATWLAPRRRGAAWSMLALAVAGLWFSACAGASMLVEQFLLKPPSALSSAQIGELKQRMKSGRAVAIVVLGGGHERFSPEYGTTNLAVQSGARLRYGVWLSRQIGAPLGYSGGPAFDSVDGSTEADAAARVALRDQDFRIRWLESASRDTHENAIYTLRLLKQDRVADVVLVTHAWHMPRAIRNFRRAAEGTDIRIVAAPMGLAPPVERQVLRWLPTFQGFMHMNVVLHELIGLAAGA